MMLLNVIDVVNAKEELLVMSVEHIKRLFNTISYLLYGFGELYLTFFHFFRKAIYFKTVYSLGLSIIVLRKIN
jgi:hypothetical protein